MGHAAWSEKRFTAFKRRKMFVSTCSLSIEKDISPHWHDFRCPWNYFGTYLKLHCDNNQVLSPAAGPRVTLPLPCYASQCSSLWPSTLCAHPGALQHLSKSSVKLPCRLLTWGFVSCPLPSFCWFFPSSPPVMIYGRKSIILKWVIDVLSKPSPLLYLFS